MATSNELREIKWIFNSTPRLAYEHIGISSRFSSYVIPPQLTTLELHMNAPIGDYILKSLCASLPCAKSLSSLKLVRIGVSDITHLINALSIRGRDNYATPIDSLHINVYEHNSSTYAHTIDISGLRWVRDLYINVDPQTRITDQLGMQQIVDEFMGVSENALSRFEYWGPPLKEAEKLSAMIHRSRATLYHLVVPQFPPTSSTTNVERAIDNASQLKTLKILWQSVRLDFVLKNKEHLETLVHYGVAYNIELLVPQLALLHNIREFYMSVNLGSAFTESMKASVKWPFCTVFYAGSPFIHNQMIQ